MGKSHGKQTFATTKEINSCENQNQTSRFESVEIKITVQNQKESDQRITLQGAQIKKNQKK